MEHFSAVFSQTSSEDKESLLLLQRHVRAKEYTYLEVGSYLGGTLQPHVADPQCKKIYSIDLRPSEVEDEMRGSGIYENNSTQHMLALLKPVGDISKIVTFDADVSDVPIAAIKQKPVLAFVDGEHTASAVKKDFAFCRRVSDRDAIIAFHDADLLWPILEDLRKELLLKEEIFTAFLLPTSVYVLHFGTDESPLRPRVLQRWRNWCILYLRRMVFRSDRLTAILVGLKKFLKKRK